MHTISTRVARKAGKLDPTPTSKAEPIAKTALFSENVYAGKTTVVAT